MDDDQAADVGQAEAEGFGGLDADAAVVEAPLRGLGAFVGKKGEPEAAIRWAWAWALGWLLLTWTR